MPEPAVLMSCMPGAYVCGPSLSMQCCSDPEIGRRDKSVQGAAAYQHWGQYIEGEVIQPEPNEYENCAGGNFTQSYGKAAGWADTNCDSEYIYICRMPGGVPPGVALAACVQSELRAALRLGQMLHT